LYGGGRAPFVPSDRFRRIAVAIDGSPAASAALEAAIDLAQRYGSELRILAIAPILPVYVAPTQPLVPSAIPASDRPHYQSLVDAAVARARAAGLESVTGYADEGSVVDEILGLLEHHPTDLLVVGSRGLSTTKRILLGSVSTALVTHAPCPVLVVRAPATKPAA
jgi:nucleotide-binding universal stress UspA family protein